MVVNSWVSLLPPTYPGRNCRNLQHGTDADNERVPRRACSQPKDWGEGGLTTKHHSGSTYPTPTKQELEEHTITPVVSVGPSRPLICMPHPAESLSDPVPSHVSVSTSTQQRGDLTSLCEADSIPQLHPTLRVSMAQR